MVLQRWIITKSKVQNEFANVSSFTWTSGIFTGVTVTEKNELVKSFVGRNKQHKFHKGVEEGAEDTPLWCASAQAESG